MTGRTVDDNGAWEPLGDPTGPFKDLTRPIRDPSKSFGDLYRTYGDPSNEMMLYSNTKYITTII